MYNPATDHMHYIVRSAYTHPEGYREIQSKRVITIAVPCWGDEKAHVQAAFDRQNMGVTIIDIDDRYIIDDYGEVAYYLDIQ